MTRPTRVLWCASVAVVTLAVSVPVAMILVKRAERARRAAEEPWREVSGWQGTKVSSGVTVPVPVPVRKTFEDDPPAPENRKAVFANHFRPARYTCAGWRAEIKSVTADSDGWEVRLTVRVIPNSGRIYDTGSTIEVWHVSKSGRARIIRCEPGSGHHFTFSG